MSFKHTVVMPKMSMTMETGELIGFHVLEGQEAKAGDVLFEVMTDKIDMEVEAPADGKVEKLLAAPSQVLEVGKPVLIMETATQVLAFDFDSPAVEAPIVQAPTPAPVIQVTQVTQVTTTPVAPAIINDNPKSVPAARKLAEQKGINLQTVKPTGPFQTITYEDVNISSGDPNIAKRQQANKELIAKGIELVLQVPQTSFSRAIYFNPKSQIEWQTQLLAKWAKVLRDFAVDQNNEIGVALIIESKYGSALPVFKDPDLMEPSQLMDLLRTTTDQAKNGRVPLAMLNGATTTIFDLTNYQMASNRPVLFPNQTTGLTIGIDTNGALSISLTIDLRALDFYDGANLLDRLANAL